MLPQPGRAASGSAPFFWPAAGTIVEAAVVGLGGPGLVVVFALESLRTADEDQHLGVDGIGARHLGRAQGFEEEDGFDMSGSVLAS